MAEYSLGTAHGTVKIDSDTKGIDQANTALGTLDKKAESSGMSIDKVGTGMAVAGAVIAGGLGVAINTAANFEQTLSGIKAVSGATAKEMDLIRDAALRIGKDTSFSASEAAGAMTELAKAGVPVEDILGGVADATVALAAATGIELPDAATYASDVMNMFGLKAENMSGIVDTLAQTANASSIDMNDLGQAFGQVGAVANLAGMSVEDTAIAIGLMGDAGIKGSDAGTSLKTMLSNLQPTTEAQSKAMMELGLMTEDGSNAFYDAQGNLKSLRDVQDILHNSTKDLTSAEKQMALETIFGSDAIRAAAVMAENGAEGFDEFAKKQADTGSAADQAKIRLDNMKGSLEGLKGSAETLGIQIGTMLIPTVRWLIDHLNEAVGWFMNLDDGTKKVVLIVVALAGGLLLLGAGIIKTVAFFKSLHSAMVTLRIISTATQTGFIKMAVTAVASWAKIAASAVLNAARSAAAWAASAAKTVAQWALMAARATANAARVAAAWLLTSGTAAATAIAQMVVAVASTVAGWVVMGVTAMANAVMVAAAWFIALGPIGWAIAALIAVVAFIIIFWDDIKGYFQAGAEFVWGILTWAFETYIGIWKAILDGIIAVALAIWAGIQQMGAWISEGWNAAISFLRQIPGWILGIFAAAGSWLVNAGRNILQGLKNGITGTWNTVIGWIGGIGGWIKGALSGAASWLISTGGDLIRGLWGGITAMKDWVLGKIKGFAGSILSGFKNFFDMGSPSKVMRDDVGRWLSIGLANGIEDNGGAAVDSATLVAANVLTAMQDGLAAGASLQATVGASLTDGQMAALGGNRAVLGATTSTAGGGLNPVTGTGAMNRSDAIDGTYGGKQIHIEMKTYNPVAEKASDNEARKLRAAAAVGAF